MFQEIGKLDYLICATKTYDIETSLESIKNCITQTRYSYLYIMVLMPRNEYKSFSENTVLQGCVYIVSMIESPGIIKK
jgi:2-dehydropantoate 2-reductase